MREGTRKRAAQPRSHTMKKSALSKASLDKAPKEDLSPTETVRKRVSTPGETPQPAGDRYSGATVCLTAITPFLRLLEEQGPEVLRTSAEHFSVLTQRWGLDGSELTGPTARLPHALVVQLLEQLEHLLGDPAAAVQAAARLHKGDYELLEYLCSTTSTLGEAIQCLEHYYPLLIAADLTLHLQGDEAEIRFRITPGLDAPNSMHEYGMLSNLIMTAQHMKLDEHTKLPNSAHFTHSEPAHAATIRALFPCPVFFDAPHNALRFPRSMLQQPMADADPALHNVLLRLADQEMEALFERSAFPAKVRGAIEATLTRGAALDDVAKELKISPNTLRSRLRQYGTTYSDLLDQYRRTYAKRALRQSQMSVAEVAHQLGFAHPPAFNRAFKRWFGMAPNAFRDGASRPIAERFLRARDTRQS